MKKKIFSLIVMILLTLQALVNLTGCSKSTPTLTQEDKNNFTTAIAQYCEKSNMGMKVSSMKLLKKSDSKALLSCKMKAKDVPSISVAWKMFMEKKDGTWHVVRHLR